LFWSRGGLPCGRRSSRMLTFTRRSRRGIVGSRALGRLTSGN